MSIPPCSTSLNASSKIGVFDSGVGGLTVLKEITQKLPQESIIYFGDTARVPYGNRSKQEILRFVREIIAWMIGLDVKMIVMACNTSSALVLEEVRSEFPIPILGIILPGARAAVRRGHNIGVISTQATANSNAYEQAIHEINPAVQVWQQGCPEFVPLIESDRIHDPYTLVAAKRYIEPLIANGIDTLVYGCTHYPHLAPVFEQIVPNAIKLVNPAIHLATAAQQELEILGLSRPKTPTQKGKTEFYVSGNPHHFGQVSEQWLGYRPQVEQVPVEVLESVHAATSKVISDR